MITITMNMTKVLSTATMKSAASSIAVVVVIFSLFSSSVEAFTCTSSMVVKRAATSALASTSAMRLPLSFSLSPLPPTTTTTTTTRSLSSLTRVQVVLRASTSDDDDNNAASEQNDVVVGLPPLPSSQRLANEGEVGAKVSASAASSSPTTSDIDNKEGGGAGSSSTTTATTSYPIDLPSPILLATSMILAIASIGSIFELTGGGGGSTSTTLGFVPTATIAALGLPLSIFLIYAAILKGAAETEEDDAQYNNQINNRRRY
ncbi:hypothetical protein ACHAXH_000352 [Discostella pseudostelligera]